MIRIKKKLILTIIYIHLFILNRLSFENAIKKTKNQENNLTLLPIKSTEEEKDDIKNGKDIKKEIDNDKENIKTNNAKDHSTYIKSYLNTNVNDGLKYLFIPSHNSFIKKYSVFNQINDGMLLNEKNDVKNNEDYKNVDYKNVNFLQYHFKELSNYNIANSIDILQEKEGHLDFVIIPHYTFLDYYKHLSYNSIYHKYSTYGKYIAVDAFIKKINETYDKVKSKCNDIKNDLIATIKKLEHPYDINNKNDDSYRYDISEEIDDKSEETDDETEEVEDSIQDTDSNHTPSNKKKNDLMNRTFKKMMDEYNTKKKKLIKCIKNHENDFNKICMDMKNYGTNLFEQLSCYNNNFCNTNGIRYHYDEYIHKLILSIKSKNLNKDLSDMTNILQQSELLLTNLNKKMGSYIYIDTIKFIHKEMKHIFNRIEYHTKIINDKTKIIQDKIKLNIWRTFQKDELLKRILDMSNEYSLFITSDHLRQMLYNTFYSKEKHLNNIFHHLIYVLQMKFNDVPIKMEYFQTYKKNKPLTQ
nr:reticulocyte-binding protein 5 [Plasmodium falciparum]UOV21379.1 reticulocyte-binding protein 5 [Plasmodium falciparum]UOV21388.1 reticulocyte-binding protein 5 [Plasmodium falciparum]UOV21422.1 reticulocyte-binding protein 5 [Plasmodium falciparum]UOV21436.1 reticulocyte-binding protein 5 [Plasmodium falciparum]